MAVPRRKDRDLYPFAQAVWALTAVMLLGSGICGLGWAAEPPPAALATGDDYIDRFVARSRLTAGNEVLGQEAERLTELAETPSSVASLLAQLQTLDAATRRAVDELVVAGVQLTLADVRQAQAAVGEQNRQLAAAWQATRTARDASRTKLAEIKASQQIGGQLASLLSVDNRWFWLSGLLAVVVLVGVVLHHRRHGLRRAFQGGIGRLVGLRRFLAVVVVLLATLTTVVFLLGEEAYRAVLSAAGEAQVPGQATELGTAQLDKEIAALEQSRQEVEQRRATAEAALQEKIAAALSEGSVGPWREFRAEIRKLQVELAVLEGLVPALEADQSERAGLETEAASQAEMAGRYLWIRQSVRSGLGLTVLGIVALGGWRFRRSSQRQHAAVEAVCPLCLGPLQEADSSGMPRSGNTEVVHCENLLSQEPRVACGYVFRRVYRPMPKLCFPTLGLPKAGKTHWLTMLYWQLNRGGYPHSVRFEKIKPVQADGSEDFDRTVEQILFSRVGTAATQRDRVPHPLVFNFKDRDPWGHSSLLVNLFDYSGEVTSDMPVDDYRRRRALQADGYLFFLDPTFPAEPQAKALADFREDLRLVQRVRAGRRVRLPIALCLPKIDLLASQPYALPDGGDAIAKFYEDLAKVDPSGRAMRLDVLEARSRLVARLSEVIWPGWHVEQAVREVFGSRYLFFPLTPVGLDGRGEADLSLRTIAPFGLLEPLMWLLEMNGYRVLE